MSWADENTSQVGTYLNERQFKSIQSYDKRVEHAASGSKLKMTCNPLLDSQTQGVGARTSRARDVPPRENNLHHTWRRR